jgi:hypothetical protein
LRFLRGFKGVTLRDRERSGDIKNLFEVNKMTDVIKKFLEKSSNVHKMQDYRLSGRVSSTNLEENGM